MKSMQIFITFCFLLVAAHLAAAQKTEDWIRFESDNGEFSVEMPPTAELFSDRTGFVYTERNGTETMLREMRVLSASTGDTNMWLEIYESTAASKAMRILGETVAATAVNLENLPPGFRGQILDVDATTSNQSVPKQTLEVSHCKKIFASPSHVYSITVANRGARTEAFKRFLDSVKLLTPVATARKLSALPSIGISDLLLPKGIGNDSATSPTKDSASQTAPLIPLLVLEKPRAEFTAEAKKARTKGQVVISGVFDAGGQIRGLSFLESKPNGLNDSVLYSVLRMKYLPARKAGRYIAVRKQIVYEFVIGSI